MLGSTLMRSRQSPMSRFPSRWPWPSGRPASRHRSGGCRSAGRRRIFYPATDPRAPAAFSAGRVSLAAVPLVKAWWRISSSRGRVRTWVRVRRRGSFGPWQGGGTMDFALSEEQQEWHDAAVKFAREELADDQDLLGRDERREFWREGWRRCARFGVQG